jgi:cyclic beta-1,2-glucan synthetase
MSLQEAEVPVDPLAKGAALTAAEHHVGTRPLEPIPLWDELGQASKWLVRARSISITRHPEAAKAVEWLVDNEYRVQRALHQIKQDLPAGFYDNLTGLDIPGQPVLPRSFAMAHDLFSSARMQISSDIVVRYLDGYQSVTPLSIAELWAFPTMLRLAALEVLVAAFTRLIPELPVGFPMTAHCAVHDPVDETECASRALTVLAAVDSISWKTVFDRTSLVERSLRADPSGTYPLMDFDTRDMYRRRIEWLGASSGRSEAEVTDAVLAKASEFAPESVRGHVGYWLIGRGRAAFVEEFGGTHARFHRLKRIAETHRGELYLAGLLLAIGAAMVLPGVYLWWAGATSEVWALGMALAFLPATILGITLVHWLVTLTIPPRVLPKMDFEAGIPSEFATAVVMPILVGRAEEVPAVLERLEIHRLANPDPGLRFVILSDLADADVERRPGDAAIETALINGVEHLNQRHAHPNENGPFHLLHRVRRFNPAQNCWMGWERKRGKLEQFNMLAMGETVEDFAVHAGDTSKLVGLRFVVTLDADTQAPQGCVAKLVGALAHPLNRACVDPDTGRILSGYTIVQPRVEISPVSARSSIFARLFTGDTSIDIYSQAVSDVYQDLFGSGIFIGKGIYDIQAFQACLDNRIPENALVSHDLFEGIHGAVAFASDIVLYETFPTGYVEYMHRWHRWVRGDWQLLPWLFSRTVKGRDRRAGINRLTPLDRWKILDNLRRSLLPVGILALVAAGWFVLPGEAWVWTALTVAAPGAYLFTDLVTGLARGRRRGAIRGTVSRVLDSLGRWSLALTFLVQEAFVATDAIVRTLWRMRVSRKHLLEWTSAAHTAAKFKAERSRWDAWSYLWTGPAVSIGIGIALAYFAPTALPASAPLLLLWLASPEIAIRISRPIRHEHEPLNAEDRAYLRRIARSTWLYFETFVGPEDNWLPPDNFQEDPYAEIAHRTSPTNIGMMALSTASAWDLGYLDSEEMAVRLDNMLHSMDRLETYRGHILNWHDTRSLTPLEPRYVSTVDSGNLAGCLIAVEACCGEALDGPPLRPKQWDGLADELELLERALLAVPDEHNADILASLSILSSHIDLFRDDPALVDGKTLARLEAECQTIERAITTAFAELESIRIEEMREVKVWSERLHHHLSGLRRAMDTFRPWCDLLNRPSLGCVDLAREMSALLPADLSLEQCAGACKHARAVLDRAIAARSGSPKEDREQDDAWLSALDQALSRGAQAHDRLKIRLISISQRAHAAAYAMDFSFLFDEERRLFHIGYNMESDRLDPHYYDLLATEARLASFFAIGKGDITAEHWFFLGRPLAELGDGPGLVSWNGSMFEYMMPALLMKSEAGTLLGDSERAAVDVQRRYTASIDIPWGVSESGYASQDPERRYRYLAFGVPGLGLRRGLSEDMVVAPYATALAIAVRPAAAVENLRALQRFDGIGRFGFIEALDFTSDRVAGDRKVSPVRSYMAHHQGMILAALDNALQDDIHVRRFHSDLRMRAIELLLHERVPLELPPEIERPEERELPRVGKPDTDPPAAWRPEPSRPFPQVHLLGNGGLTELLSDTGGGGLSWHGQALTRWTADTTLDDQGIGIHVTDLDTGARWSVTQRFPASSASDAGVVFHPHLAEFHRRVDDVAIRMEVGIAAGDDVEIRRLTLVNRGDQPKRLSLSSFGEVVLAAPMDDERHPAFSKLFVHSEHVPGMDGLLFTRNPRNPKEKPPVLLHRVLFDDPRISFTGFDTDRRTALGRHGKAPGHAHQPAGTTGWTFDPVFALEVAVELGPHETVTLAFMTMASGARSSVLDLAERFATLTSTDWAFSDALADVKREVQRLQLAPEPLNALQILASLLAYPTTALKPPQPALPEPGVAQPDLWSIGVSGDLPILVCRVKGSEWSELLRVLVVGHRLWRRRGLFVDLVILRDVPSSYLEPTRDKLSSMLREMGGEVGLGERGGVHLLFADQIGEQHCASLVAAARVFLSDEKPDLAAWLAEIRDDTLDMPEFRPTAPASPPAEDPPLPRPTDLRFDNGLGGFSADGKAYVIHLEPGTTTPSPWSNVLANDAFGTIVTEAGLGFSWAANSSENKLTRSSGDPIADPAGEALYLRDEETAGVWSPTPLPCGGLSACQIRHGTGSTTWTRRSHGLKQELTVFVAVEDPVKIVRLRLSNTRAQPRRITATYFADWVLGPVVSTSKPRVRCAYEPKAHALLARNSWNPDFADRVAFLTSTHVPHGVTNDRRSFLGPNGSASLPAALGRWGLGQPDNAPADSCAAFQVHLDIEANGLVEATFILGQGDTLDHALTLISKWQDPAAVDAEAEATVQAWEDRVSAVRVTTPDPAFDLMVNRWLPYQNLASRILARAGFYQVGGAFGFRDQLQDVMALLHSEPDRARAHILASAAHQFEEGDVLHWWHPPADRGVRTRCSDDLVWLVYVTAYYVNATGDFGILDARIPYLSAPPLAEDEHDRYSRFDAHGAEQSLLEHCLRALKRAEPTGSHALPLIGGGDWNDGMDRVGAGGRGESVWLAWFLIATIRMFAPIIADRDRRDMAEALQARATRLEEAIEQAAWDGAWYVRAFDDDGRPLGASENEECSIDAIAQAWSVLAREAPNDRSRMAVRSALENLVEDESSPVSASGSGILRLLWPPFSTGEHDPGYIQAYPPGVRENGGQYTHAAIWLGWALAALGDGDEAQAMFHRVTPVHRASTAEGVGRYLVEPYVVAADISGVAPHVGRGGWSWYTGSAAWAWRFGVEAMLGLRLKHGALAIDPCIPKAWGVFEAVLKGQSGSLHVTVVDTGHIGRGVSRIIIDGERHEDSAVAFPTDGSTRQVIVHLGPVARPAN